MGTVALIIILFLSVFFISCSSSTRSEYEMKLLYEGWLVEHHKNYNDLFEKDKRYEIFKDNLKYIDEHNAGNHTYQLGLNLFADLTVDEYQNNDLGFNPLSKMNMTYKVSSRYMLDKGEELKLPNSVDWREKGAVTHVKNQGKCNSSWAFTTIATIESLNKIVTGELISLSEQELIDCYRKGCGRDDPVKAFEFIILNHGIDTAEDYPYRAVYSKCDLSKKKKKVVSINGYVLGPFNNENAMKGGGGKATCYWRC
ncbi:probable cysteine protease RD21B [Dioscorea cayenensis subsp. rotundata]|uniref:Probable cysteine protease RD21B n=1 Tax=Dioscorea cayennensis subsp. rotundata TaxID=55577 RepID=A0AB40BYF0_DIOCR|nr:probable cysteine protease RD21B [Dioscorea cayenensis subsp. rotundata]